MSPNDTIGNDMQSTTPAIDFNGLFDAPSRNIQSAFEVVLDLIERQTREISDLRQAQIEAAVKNDELKSQLERAEDHWAKHRTNVAAEFQKLKGECGDLLALHQKTEASVSNIQQEMKVCQCV